jgi:hypothetical protein
MNEIEKLKSLLQDAIEMGYGLSNSIQIILKEWEEREFEKNTSNPSPDCPFRVGDKLKVKDGYLGAGYKFECIGIDNEGRCYHSKEFQQLMGWHYTMLVKVLPKKKKQNLQKPQIPF